MAELDRSQLIALLSQLGDPSDTVALDAARTADAMVRLAGTSWAALLTPASAPDMDDAEIVAVLDAAPDPEGDDRLIAALLGRSDLSVETRDELVGFRRDLAAGALSAMDRRYVRGLAKKLGV